ncbi:hydantoinase B/oxoprolinase family protein [Paracoccus suum]|uniref:Hydantoinase B/oxoprolinase family protein n=1 Tax=Paracoccus suum TaxID=2259340 RepID=A0A344PMZ6_9RHOB|nr:hydantoinase B/oxoprolinase family protein [Paracoccus suum]AXC50751.1 hydantoinase B/oxoprolinase family protein [Paracoccus suum]
MKTSEYATPTAAPAAGQLDPVTFEVLKNAFITSVNQMSEQILRTCYSFVIYNRDFSNGLNDANGDSVAQGTKDLAGHVGTLHLTCKDVIRVFKGRMEDGDVYAINDPYAGGTHFPDVRLIRPIFVDGEVIAFAQSNGHWTDMGGSVPGSFDVKARDMFREGMRITPVRVWHAGRFCDDVANLIAAQTRDPVSIIGDMQSQAEATRIGEREIHRLVKKYGKDTVLAGFAQVQDYVERATLQQLSALPKGTWETVDFMDRDHGKGEGLIPIKVKLTLTGDKIIYDFTGSHPCVASLYNSAFGGTFSACVAATKYFFPELPLNSGFYRVIEVIAPEDTVVNAKWPVAVTGFVMPFDKIVNAVAGMWSEIVPERAMACTFHNEYMLAGGEDARHGDRQIFMYYDWLPGGWGARNGKDGANLTSILFGTGLQSQPAEGQERASPILTTEYQVLVDSAGPGKWRGGVGVVKSTELLDVENTVISYFCDRERSVVYGIQGGLPACPHGITLTRAGETEGSWLGAAFSDVPVSRGDAFSRPTAGGGGFGDVLERDAQAVLEDVADGYVSLRRAERDYGVVLKVVDQDLEEYEIDEAATRKARDYIRQNRVAWARENPETVAENFRKGEIDVLDVLRRHAVILEWGTGELLEKSTQQFREMFEKRTVAFWDA